MGAKDRLRAAAVAGLLLTGCPSAFGQNWTLTSAPITNWTSIAMSADGDKLVATSSGLIYASTNFGTVWIPTEAPENYWSSVASSADGTKLAAVALWDAPPAGIWTSTNSGLSWMPSNDPKTNRWVGIASSAGGDNLVAIDSGGYHYPGRVFTSTNCGAAWANPYLVWPAEHLTSVATSADGARSMVASTYSIYASEDFGQTWTPAGAPGNWSGVRCSADGVKCVAVSPYGGIQLSTNAGVNWISASAPSLAWSGLASSSDGSRLAVAAGAAPIYLSTNSGATWSPSTAPTKNWQSVASSADGCKLTAVVNGGGIYTWQTTPSPKLNITPTASGLLISWIVPSMPFELQETADLNTPDWTAVPMTRVLNLTNLHHEVTVPLTNASRFYRLQSR